MSTLQQRDDDPPNDSTDNEEDEDNELKQTNSCLSIGMSTLGYTVNNNDALIIDTITAATNKASAGDWKKRQQDKLQKSQLKKIAQEHARQEQSWKEESQSGRRNDNNVIVGSVGNADAEVRTRGNTSNPRGQQQRAFFQYSNGTNANHNHNAAVNSNDNHSISM